MSDIARHGNSKTDYLTDSGVSTVLMDESLVDAEQRLIGKQKLASFTEAVAQLPPQCRRVFMLRKFDGLKVKEIARRLDLSVSSVEKHIANGLVKCADYMSEQGHEAQGKKPHAKSRKDRIVGTIVPNRETKRDG